MKKSALLLAAAIALFAGTIRPASAMTLCQGLGIEAAGWYAQAAAAFAAGDYATAGADYAIASSEASAASQCKD